MVLTWYAENQIPNFPFLRLPWNLARMWSDVQACWNSLDPVIHFGQSKDWWPYMQHSCIQHTIDFYSWKVDGKALWFNPAFFILKSCTTTTTPECRFYPKDTTVSSLAACNRCNKKTIGDMVVTKKDDITERRRGVAIPRACPSRHFLRPHSLFAASLHLERTSVTIPLRDQTSAPSKGKWTANWSTLLHWSSAAMRRNELLLSELLGRTLNALSARCPGLEGPERCLVAESPETSSTLIIRPSAGLFTFSPHADHVSSSS